MKLVDVINAVLHAAKVAVAQQVILFVGVERAGNDVAVELVFQTIIQKVGDFLAIAAAQSRSQVGMRENHRASDQLVNLFLLSGAVEGALRGQRLEHIFRNVRKRTVSDIVKQGSESDDLGMVIINLQHLAKPARNMEHAQRVIEAGV